VLSVPFVVVMNAFGISAINVEGAYDLHGELVIQTNLAALLMAGLTALFFLTSRLLLPLLWSMLIALGAALGTQVWSTASRGLWSDTWALALLGFVVFMVLAQETGKRQFSPLVFASVLSWMYFVRPAYALHIVAITVYFLVFQWQKFLRYAITGMFWFALFVLFSWHVFGQILPNYYQANRLSFSTFGMAMAGHLISPSRGLLVYVPVLLFVAYLLLRYWREVWSPPLAVLSLGIIAGHLMVHSMFSPWHGGGCYGPRHSTGLVP
jgi:hypothetical protein